jgi:hypothetical protein
MRKLMADGFSMTPRLVLEFRHGYGIFYASKTFYDARKGRRVFSVRRGDELENPIYI